MKDEIVIRNDIDKTTENQLAFIEKKDKSEFSHIDPMKFIDHLHLKTTINFDEIDVQNERIWRILRLEIYCKNLNFIKEFMEEISKNLDNEEINFFKNLILRYAAEYDDLDLVKYLLDKKIIKMDVQIDFQNENKISLIIVAAEYGSKNIAEYLADNGADINAVVVIEKMQYTVLHAAVKSRNTELVKFLLEKRNSTGERIINIDKEDEYLESPLHLAAGLGNQDMVELLIENEANINVLTKNNETVLHYAIKSGNKNLVKFLLEKRNSTGERIINIDKEDEYLGSPLHLAARLGNLDIVELLIENGANINALTKNNETVLHHAVKSDNLGLIKFLLNKKIIDLNIKDKNNITILDLIIMSKFQSEIGISNDISNFLVNSGAESSIVKALPDTILKKLMEGDEKDLELNRKRLINDTEENISTPLSTKTCKEFHIEAEKGNKDMVEFFINYGVNINLLNQNRGTILHSTAKSDNIELAKFLLEKRNAIGERIINIDSKDEYGMTPLHIAAENGNKAMVKFLIENGADITISSENRNIVLHYAVKSGNIELVKFLLEKRKAKGKRIIDINSKNKFGITPVYFAVLKSDLNMLQFLIRNGADLTILYENQNIILHCAAITGNRDIVEFLLSQGTLKVNSKNKDDITPLYLAVKKGDRNIVQCLTENGAELTILYENQNTILHYAAVIGNRDIVEFLLNQKKLKINIKNKDGMSSADYAMQRYISLKDLKDDESEVKNEQIMALIETIKLLRNNGAIFFNSNYGHILEKFMQDHIKLKAELENEAKSKKKDQAQRYNVTEANSEIKTRNFTQNNNNINKYI